MSDKKNTEVRILSSCVTDTWGFSYYCGSTYCSGHNTYHEDCTIKAGICAYDAAPYFDIGPIPSSVDILLGSSESVLISGLYNPRG